MIMPVSSPGREYKPPLNTTYIHRRVARTTVRNLQSTHNRLLNAPHYGLCHFQRLRQNLKQESRREGSQTLKEAGTRPEQDYKSFFRV